MESFLNLIMSLFLFEELRFYSHCLSMILQRLYQSLELEGKEPNVAPPLSESCALPGGSLDSDVFLPLVLLLLQPGHLLMMSDPQWCCCCCCAVFFDGSGVVTEWEAGSEGGELWLVVREADMESDCFLWCCLLWLLLQ
jgi:hypothetical protein